MSCRKKAFESESSALDWMRKRAYSNRRTGQTPTRAYQCTNERCRKWHLTSKPLGKKQSNG